MNSSKYFSLSDKNSVRDALVFVQENLRRVKTGDKLTNSAMVACEEMIALFVKHAPEDGSLQVKFSKSLGEYYITLRCKGDEFDPFDNYVEKTSELSRMDRDDASSAIRSILLMSYGNQLRYSNRNGVNRVQISVGKAEQSMLKNTVIALVMGLAVGLILKFLFPEKITDAVVFYALEPVKIMFMNAIKIIIGPVIFFSMVSCLSSFKSLSELGRIGAKVMVSYVLTTILAVSLAVGLSLLFKPGTEGFAADGNAAAAVDVSTDIDTSLRTTIINIVPSNLFVPFVETNTMQLLFLAVLFGIAVGMTEEYSGALKKFFDAGNTLVLTVTSIITRFIPLAVFASVALIVDQLGLDSVRSLAGYIGVHLSAVACMLIVYGLIILIFGRLNPLKFYSKFKEGMLTGLALASSTASMPTNLRICTEKLGISHKVCDFSIPLGATVNMDGTSITLVIGGLFLARAYGVDVSWSLLASVMITIVLLSLGCPGVPGAGLVCLGIILQLMGVPIEALGLLIGIYPFIDMVNTMSNITGDVAVTTVVARSEGLIDTDVYNRHD